MWQEIENLCGVMFCYIGAVCFRGGNGMERKQGIGFRLGACALKNAERRMPRVQNMRSGEENTQVTIHALVKGATNFYRRESNCGVIDHGLKQTGSHVICYRHSSRITVGLTQTGSHVICYRRYRITLQLREPNSTIVSIGWMVSMSWWERDTVSVVWSIWCCVLVLPLLRVAARKRWGDCCNVDWWLSSTTGVTCHGQ